MAFVWLLKLKILKLQRIQNAAARLSMTIGKHFHFTPARYDLHWFPVRARIRFNISVLAFKEIHGLVPLYISDWITAPCYWSRLRKKKCFQLWSSLLPELRAIPSGTIFKRNLQTYLFGQVFLYQFRPEILLSLWLLFILIYFFTCFILLSH